MNRIEVTLKKLQAAKKKSLSPYLTAGDPFPEATVDLMHALVQAGADILELGIPFSDPMAEGPVIQAAMERALTYKINCNHVLEMVKAFRNKNNETPIVIMGYTNPIEYYGYERFAQHAKEAGVDGTILVDLPPEESEEISAIWKAYDLYSIYLCSPTTSPKRMQLINQFGQGYLYYVSLKGVTGSNALDLETIESLYRERKLQTHLPVMVGFGIKTPEVAAQVAKFSDGVIVGAALVNAIIEAHQTQQDILKAGSALIHNMRHAIDNIE